jgi:adenosylcobinamide-phosphate synthase
MSFISVLFALLLEQARPLTRGNPIHATLRAWVRWSTRNFDAGKPLHGWLAWGFAVGAPSLAALLIYWLLGIYAGWPLAVLWSALVLYTSLGFRQFSSHFTQIRDALADGDDAQAQALLASWQHIEVKSMPRSEMIGRVIEFSVLAAHRHVFGVLAWFSVLAAFGLGPTGAVLYRVSEFVARYWRHKSEAHHQPVSPALQQNAQIAWSLIDWLPARLTAIGFAVVGNFEEAVDGWRRYAQQPGSNQDGLVLAATAGAVNICLPAVSGRFDRDTAVQVILAVDDVPAGRPLPELQHLAVVVGLVWRTVVMWILLLALLTLARLLG